MKNFSLLFIAFLFLQFTSLAQVGWVEQTSGTQSHLSSVFFVNSNMGWAVGYEGTIIHTLDGGETWLEQQSGIDSCIWKSVFFIDSDNGYVAGGQVSGGLPAYGIILKTTNGGTDWTTSFFDSLNSPLVRSIYFIDQSYGWAVGDDTLIVSTTDGGAIWIPQSTGVPPFYGDYYSVFFVNETTGWVLNRVNIQKTTDGGSTWIGQSVPAGEHPSFRDVHFINSEIGWIGGSSIFGDLDNCIISKTTDGGNNWEPGGFSPYSYFGYTNSVFFIDYNYGWAVTGWPSGGGSGRILGTINSGLEWTEQLNFIDNSLNDVFFIDVNTGWVVGGYGIILHTTNGGVSFVEEEQNDEIPTDYSLTQNFPNPFNPSTKLKYSIPQSSNVVIKVFDVLGNEIETLVNEEKSVGTYELTWNAENLPSGIYFYQLKTNEFVETKKMILLK